MKISTILDHIDNGHFALPAFQRGYVWNREQVRRLMDSLYRRHPAGTLLVWVAQSDGAKYRGGGSLPPGVVKLLLDGQQRATSLYGIIRGKPPKFFEGDDQAFTNLQFHLEKEEFEFYSPVHMKDDPLWIDVSKLMLAGAEGLGSFVATMGGIPELAPKIGTYAGRLSRLLGITEIDFHVEEVTGQDKTIDVVVDIFNRVNSSGTKLSKGDLALAKICADWPEARDRFRASLKKWQQHSYEFDMDWLLRCVNTVVTGEARFLHLHDVPEADVRAGVQRAEKAIDTLLNDIADRLGLDHDRVLFGRYALPVMAHYLDRRGGSFGDQAEKDRLLFWYLQAAMWGRFSGSTESYIDQDLESISDLDGGLDRLIDQMRLWHGSLAVVPGHFSGWSLGARFYPVLYLLTRTGEARDFLSGIALKRGLLGKMSELDVHHVFPKALLYKHNYNRADVNAVANFCFLTKESNIKIGKKPPSHYFAEAERKHPGVLASQWIPMDTALWRPESYLDFLEERKRLLAEATNSFLAELYHGPLPTAHVPVAGVAEAIGLDQVVLAPEQVVGGVPGSIETPEEEAILNGVNDWVSSLRLADGILAYELSHPDSGDPQAVLDLAWPRGLQYGCSEPVALLLNEGPETLAVASQAGFRVFTTPASFRVYVEGEIVGGRESAVVVAAV